MTALKVLYFDVETISDYARSDLWLARKEKPEDVDEQTWTLEQMKLMALQPEACQLVGLNVIVGSGEPKSGWVGELSQQTGLPYSEQDLLTLFWSWAAQCPRLVGFNCLRFDLPVIYCRSSLLGVPPTVDFTDIKPWQSIIVDILARRFGHSRDFMSLKALRRVLQLPVPDKYAEVLDNTGADIEELYLRFLAGDADALRVLKLYGELDVWSTKALAQLWSGYFFTRIE